MKSVLVLKRECYTRKNLVANTFRGIVFILRHYRKTISNHENARNIIYPLIILDSQLLGSRTVWNFG